MILFSNGMHADILQVHKNIVAQFDKYCIVESLEELKVHSTDLRLSSSASIYNLFMDIDSLGLHFLSIYLLVN
jgi:hypothetical protein